MRQLVMLTALTALTFALTTETAQARGGRGGRSCGGGGCGSGGCGSSYSHGYSSCGSCSGYSHGSSCGSCYAAPSHHGGHCASCVSASPVVTGGCPTCVAGVPTAAPAYALAEAPATLVVSLPADAALRVDGHATTSTSEVRTFASPALSTTRDASYTLTATVVRNGKTETVSKEVVVRGGETTRVTLKFPGTDVASK